MSVRSANAPSLPRTAKVFAGFTLIEMAVVVVIVTLLLSLGLGALNAQLASAAQAETRKRQAIVLDALTAYLGAHRRLPCPDLPNNTHGASDSSQVTGAEDRVGGAVTGACTTNIGVVPYATLGLSRELATDGWGNFMSYSIPPSSGSCPAGINWVLSACFGAAKTSPYALYEGSGAAPTLLASNVLAVVVAYGPNGLGAWARQGSRNVLPLGCEEARNTLTAVSGCSVPAHSFFRGDRAELDDVVSALSRDEAINALVKQGTLRSIDAQVAEDFTTIRNDKLYAKASTDDCGVSVGGTTLRDPWGSLYVVAEGSVNGLPICICSNRGTGSVPAPVSSCEPVAPATCTVVRASDVNLLRVPMGKSPC